MVLFVVVWLCFCCDLFLKYSRWYYIVAVRGYWLAIIYYFILLIYYLFGN